LTKAVLVTLLLDQLTVRVCFADRLAETHAQLAQYQGKVAFLCWAQAWYILSLCLLI